AGIALAVVGAAGGGVFMWLMAPASEESVAWALLVARGAAMPVFLAAVVARGVPVGAALATRVAAAEMVTVGVLAFAAAALYAGATQHGLLSLVSVLGSLYPAVTVLLAWRLIGERMDAARWAGVVGVMAGVVLIAAG
ncbi:MAG TPA: EamA family transporter, partial [Solirubrobacteraceae bacterium]|nr:EamA family transporter [Solirubrobacteraceae bacterium]